MAVTGPSFISLQTRDLDASAAFYETHLGLQRAPVAPPGAVVFATQPIAFAVRATPEGGAPVAAAQPGEGVALWMHAPDAQELHDAMADAGVEIRTPPFDGPFGRTFVLVDLDGYLVTVHDRV